ncbi:MAG: hypothetical protein HYV03_07330 [Deltaproteobacteria bacterium]|nr:hypothetical protein [Deltaproteobacteria bacterium]
MFQRTTKQKGIYGSAAGRHEDAEVVISLESGEPIGNKPATTKDPLLELQLAMATSSINHAYARIEYDESGDQERREELLHYMDNCREKYLNARDQLSQLSPQTLERFERDLTFQKQTTLSQYHA